MATFGYLKLSIGKMVDPALTITVRRQGAEDALHFVFVALPDPEPGDFVFDFGF
ncbi:MAG TPA: hypothetical protein VNM15_10980 [Candidatus Binatia bacterium]|nr:hypothetical protein [Candidatus Binatia bacterium]